MIERLVSLFFTLLAYISPQASESIDLGDDMDSLPEHPADVQTSYGYPEDDHNTGGRVSG